MLAHDFKELTATKTKSPPFDTNYKAATDVSVAALSIYGVFGFLISVKVLWFSIYSNKFPVTSVEVDASSVSANFVQRYSQISSLIFMFLYHALYIDNALSRMRFIVFFAISSSFMDEYLSVIHSLSHADH